MDDPDGGIFCDIMRWCNLVSALTKEQREKLSTCAVGRCMLQIPSRKMRPLLIKYMIQVYDVEKRKFIIEPRVGEISARNEDVECLLGLEDEGLSSADILEEEGEEWKTNIPPRFLSKKTGNLVMKDMIEQIITSKATDDDFLRRVVLILIGTVLAPTSNYTVHKPFYAFVETMYKLHNLNWKQFTLAYVIEQISTCRRGIYIRQWPKGNVAILEYLYWEKVQPLDEIALCARISSRPLMINWTEATVGLRDNYDQENGRGKGILKIEDIITEEYRRSYGKKTDANNKSGADIKKPPTGRSNGRSNGKPSSSKKPAPSWEITMEINMKRMMQELKREIMEELPERCAKDVVKLLNKSGVRYKPMREAFSDKDCYEEGCGSFLNGAAERKEFVYDKQKCHTPNPCDYFVGDGTPENPWQVNEAAKYASSSEVPSNIFEPALHNMKKNDEHKGAASEGSKSLNSATGKTEDVNGKRKRKLPLKLQHPFIIENPPKRQPRKKQTPAIAIASTNDVEIPQDSTALTAEHIAAAEIFVQLRCKTEENGKKCVYKNDIGVTLTSQRLKVVLDHKWCTDDVIDAYIGDLSLRVGDDRYLCSAWRSSFLLEKHRKGQKTKKSNKNDDHLAARTGAIQRVMDEYFKREKAYFPVNISNNHWTTVIMHIPKEEFQVLDSLYPLTQTIETVRALRQQIAADIREYNKCTTGFFPDVSTWNIKSYDMPQQKDGNSCGLFVLQCMEHWDGDKWTTEISQEMVNASRKLINAQIVLATSNLLETVKTKVVRISKRVLT
ncbi:hypothetical protein ACQ4PT_001872 [Festuca glaucescens]